LPTSKVLLALILIVSLLAPTQVLFAQQPTQAPPAAAPGPAQETARTPPPTIENLKVLILEGDGAINDIEKHIIKIPVVEVRDDDDKPVEGVEVVFRLPVNGPGGSFPGGQTSKTTKTNAQGQAAATGLTLNNQTGRFEIKVTASIGNRVGQGTVSQTSALKVKVEPEKKTHSGGLLGLSWKKVAIIGGITGGAIVAIVLATRGSSSNPNITITPGPVTIGGR